MRVLPSTSGSSVWVVVAEGCNPATDPQDCPERRGELFASNASSSLVQKGFYELPLQAEEILGYSGNGQFAYDQITLGGNGAGGPALNNTMFAGIATKDFLIGTMGLTPWGVNFTDSNNPVPSLLTSLKNAGLVTSNSWGYSAGAFYSPKQTSGSLTFGGYDASRFVPNNLTFTRGPDIARDLLIGIQTITSGTDSLLLEGVVAMIDSTVAQIWLPNEACRRFEEIFGLVWDETAELYLVNDTLHQKLVDEDPSVTFTIGSNTTSSDIINIVLPYGAFDLTADWPLTTNGTARYFPLRRAANASQVVLGRTFLQEAYLIVDYDRNNFSLSRAVFPDTNVPQQLVTILPPSEKGSSHGRLAKGAIIGIGVGTAAIIVALIATFLYLMRRRWLPSAPKIQVTTNAPEETKPELDAQQTPNFSGMGTPVSLNSTPVEAKGSQRFPREMYDPSIIRPEVQGDSRRPVELAECARVVRHELSG
ncbi:hypothetical protein EPUS_02123 [Endocarpon pusillum Z07020]|uniref:Peptidase A1 domain-containing protein n=1 Tax=Endocarpon pusillum (strain Z07020 / HMAS-L-300199) TaxID=1263415 RepID=U1GK59_ENDPU|nr:uncharacterized protein EPUS_02123 [Endocarpon pusillum Z07020]ERF72236.1 hypothetical protein EPUS_02123 [Endocarpon pusillum Z07020]